MDQITCLLPGGYVDGAGAVHRHVELTSLSGREEEFLASNGRWDSASLVTVVLSRCVQRLGSISPVSKEVMRDLLIADRQVLLLKLRELTFGDRIRTTIVCSWPDCANRVDIDFSIQDIPIKESEDKGPAYKMQLSPQAAFTGDDGEVYREITFRLPNGGDQETIAPLLVENEAMAAEMLLGRCILGIGRIKNPGLERVSQLPALARMEIEGQMEAIAPQVELTMEGECPECGREFAVPFDHHGFIFGELRTSLDLLYREVHYLAFHYHWSEREIMAMPREKRRKYIEVLAEEIERLNDAIR
jgi:hypothetical protein